MVGLRRIARCRTNAAIGFCDECIIVEVFIRRITPELGAHALVHPFGKSLGQPVGQRLRHDRRIIVTGFFKTLGDVIFAMPRGDGKTANIISRAACRRHEIGQREIRPPAAVLHLLAKRVEPRSFFCAAFIFIHNNVIAVARRRPKADHRARGEPFLRNHVVEHVLSVGKQAGCRRAHHIIGQNGRIGSVQIPALEKRRPVNIVAQFRQIIIVEHFRAGKRRRDRRVCNLRRKRIGPRISQRAALCIGPSARMRFGHGFIIAANFLLVGGTLFFRQ